MKDLVPLYLMIVDTYSPVPMIATLSTLFTRDLKRIIYDSLHRQQGIPEVGEEPN